MSCWKSFDRPRYPECTTAATIRNARTALPAGPALRERWIGASAAPAAARPCGQGRLLVVGGGLSAAQLALHALRLGWAEVALLVQGSLAERPFDIGVDWMARHHAIDLTDAEAAFHRSGPQERRELLAQARPGGSVTPCCARELAEREHDA